MRDSLTVFVNGKRHNVAGAAVFSSLSTWLRTTLGLTGTKVVCAEGDCGSCAAMLGRARAGRAEYRPVTSCIQYLYQLDGAHVVTIEGLLYAGQLNPVQEAMVACHGAQCGFCTPGFVVSLCSLYESRKQPGEEALRTALTGNLCRCTGYESILKSARSVDPARMKPVEELYPSAVLAGPMDEAQRTAVLAKWGGKTFFKPTTVAEAVEFRAKNPDSTLVAGGTDLGVVMNKGIRDPETIMYVGAITALRELRRDGDTLIVGANVTLDELEPQTAQPMPEFAAMLRRHGSPLIRSAATLAGNIANGSPIADALPALFVLDAEVELTGVQGPRRVNINAFYAGYRKTVARPDEIITRIFIPLPKAGQSLKLHQVSRRWDLDISTFTAAMLLSRTNGNIDDARVAFGGVAPVIIRLPQTEAFLRGRPITMETFREAGAIARTEVTPISDVRGSAQYRLTLAQNILPRFFAQLAGLDEIDAEPASAGGRA